MARVEKNIHEYERRPWWRGETGGKGGERSGGNTVKCHRAILIYGAGKSAEVELGVESAWPETEKFSLVRTFIEVRFADGGLQ